MTAGKIVRTGPLPADDTPINTRRLKHFVVAMEEPSLSSAARVLYVTPQALSTSIRRLERELGVQLFERDGRGLHPTSAARALYAGARTLLSRNTALAQQVRKVAAGRAPLFSVGYTPAVLPEEVYRGLTPVLRRIADAQICARSIDSAAVLQPLLCGDLDLVLRSGAQKVDGFETEVVAYRELRVAVSADSDLAAAYTVDIRALADRTIVVPAPEHVSAFTNTIVTSCRSAGFEPRMHLGAMHGLPLHAAAIDAPDVAAFTTAAVGPACDGDVRVIALTREIIIPIQMIWLPDSMPELRSMLEAASPTG